MMTKILRTSLDISFMLKAFGFVSRMFVKVPVLGKSTIGFSNKMIGNVLPNLKFFGYRKEATYENAVWNWENFLDIIKADYDVEIDSQNSRTYTIYKCPAGYCRLEHLNACQATMELDHCLVAKSGAKLIVEKRIPTDGICIEKIIKS